MPIRTEGRLPLDPSGLSAGVPGGAVDADPRAALAARAVQPELVALPAELPASLFEILKHAVYGGVDLAPDGRDRDPVALPHRAPV